MWVIFRAKGAFFHGIGVLYRAKCSEKVRPKHMVRFISGLISGA